MKYISEFRNPEHIHQLVKAISNIAKKPMTIMEVCGGQTHAIIKYGLDQLLTTNVELIHGPGCPVCVTPTSVIDKAIALSYCENLTLCSFGDMMRVPGCRGDLLSAKAQGANIKMVYSPLDAVSFAQKTPKQEVVFFAVGFETTAPTIALAIQQAKALKLKNFSVLVSHVLVPPAIKAILAEKHCRIEGFLAAGHVCTIMGYKAYDALAKQYKVPIIVTGFEPLDILQGIYLCIQQRNMEDPKVVNQYQRAVLAEGNRHAQQLLQDVFEITAQEWRGIGLIPSSGLQLSANYQDFNAEKRFNCLDIKNSNHQSCISGLVLQGVKKPLDCPAFGIQCTPDSPLGAPMVSSEGACSAYYRYRRNNHVA